MEDLNVKKGFTFWIDRLSSPAVVFYTLPALMALLLAGTVAQRSLGLYEAHQTFFASFLFWAGPVPLPGGYTLLGAITLSLLVKFLFKSRWEWRQSGIILAHLGVLVLLAGGLITAVSAREGFIVLPEGGKAAHVLDYYQRKLVLLQNDNVIAGVPFQDIESGETLRFDSLPFQIQVHDVCRNCGIIAREEAQQDSDGALRSMARFMALEAKKPEKEDEANLYGASLEIQGSDNEEENGAYIVFEGMPQAITLTHGGQSYDLLFGKAQRALPFALELRSFEKTMYPGTNKARSYQSDILIQDGDLSWPVRISMNRPLRYKGYTFFQSSFIGPEGAESSVLNVVWNRGWLFPYIGTLIIAAGLLLHIFQRACEKKKT